MVVDSLEGLPVHRDDIRVVGQSGSKVNVDLRHFLQFSSVCLIAHNRFFDIESRVFVLFFGRAQITWLKMLSFVSLVHGRMNLLKLNELFICC